VSELPLLAVDGLSVDIAGRRVLDGVSFAVAPGEIVALVGESGSGKTVAARTLLGLLPFGARVAQGQARFRGLDLVQQSGAQLRAVRGAGIGLIFQEPMTSLNPSMTCGRQMADGLRLHCALDAAAARARCLDMLARVRIADPVAAFDRYPHQLSGGMRQRISIAAAMLLEPALLVADEPTTALDVLVQGEVLALLVELARAAGTGVLLITHDLGLVAEYAGRVIVMRSGRVVEAGRAADLLAGPRAPYTRSLLAAVPTRAARPPVAGAEHLRIEGLLVRFAGRRERPWKAPPVIRPLDGLSLSARRGETLAVVGESGSGKTTLMRTVMRLVDAAAGRIMLGGTDVTRLEGDALAAYRQRVAMIFQDPFSALDPRLRIGAAVAEGLRHRPGLSGDERRQRTAAILAEVGLGPEYLRRFPHQLSGGQRQRVNIARALIGDPELVIADEPVSALDVTVQAEILRLFARLQGARGFTCLFVTHSLAVVEQVADRVAVMRWGRIIEEGSRDAVFDRPRHPYTSALLRAAPRIVADPAGRYGVARYPVREPTPPPGFAFPADRATADRSALIEVAPDHHVALVSLSASQAA
jgi:peptide/nickel transport system ATP-binding protein